MIIQSLLDTDLYKFTMMQVVLHHFPGAQAEFRFKCRTPGVDLARGLDEIREEVRGLCALRFSPAELGYLRGLRFLRDDFVDFLGLFHLNEQFIDIRPSPLPGEIEIMIRGPWLHTILFEVPVLAIVNEVHFRGTDGAEAHREGHRRLRQKCAVLREQADTDCRIADYGTRRRFSGAWHDELIGELPALLGPQLAGTSNVWHAMKYGLTPIGSMAHEFLQGCQALGPRLRDSQKFALETWASEYRGDLGIALSDTYGMDAFLRDFDLYFCKLFDGARHDSGDPFEWGERMLAHYESMRVDPLGKTLVFSDGLTMQRIVELYARFRHRCRLAFGIGTNLTNDLGPEPINIVIKMTRCNGQPVAKLSDSPEKTMCDDPGYLAYLREVFTVPKLGRRPKAATEVVMRKGSEPEPGYVLHYWPGLPGRGEFVRLTLEAAGAHYRDAAQQGGDGLASPMWEIDGKAVKTPGFAPPILCHGRLVIAQTANILAYLGPRHALAPDDEAGRLWLNQLQLTLADWVSEIHDTHHPIASGLYYEEQSEEAARRTEEFLLSRLPKFLNYFDRVIALEPGPYLIGSRMSYADLSLFLVVEGLRYALPTAMRRHEARHPRITALADAVLRHPPLAGYWHSARRQPFGDGLFRFYPELDALARKGDD